MRFDCFVLCLVVMNVYCFCFYIIKYFYVDFKVIFMKLFVYLIGFLVISNC